ncbi:MAG: flagellar hook-length control protein FliK [Magnetococcales bacterium]|nr:flagellar hook-length control protein FliK [Magnetococcales bacterium]
MSNIMGELMRLARSGAGNQPLLPVDANKNLQQSALEVAKETQAAAVKTPWWSLGNDGSAFNSVMQENINAALPLPNSVVPATSLTTEMLEATVMADTMAGTATTGHLSAANQRFELLLSHTGQMDSGNNTTVTEMALASRASLSNEVTTADNVKTLSPNSPQFGQDLVDQIGRMRLISRPGMPEEVRLTLDPEDLGTLHIRVQIDRERQVQVSIVAESEAVREIINRQMPQLKEALARSNLIFGEVTVQLDSDQSQPGNQNSTGYSRDSSWDQSTVITPRSMNRELLGLESSPLRTTWTKTNNGLSIFA